MCFDYRRRWLLSAGDGRLSEIILAAKTSRVGPAARAICGEAAPANHDSANCTPPCDNLVALGMRAFTPSFRCNYRFTKPRQIVSSLRHFSVPIGARRVFPQLGPHYLFQKPLGLLQHRTSHVTSLDQDEPTIYALSTASGKAAIAVIRISGSACRQVHLI